MTTRKDVLIVFGIPLLLFVLYVLIFIIIRPFNNTIVEGRPFLTWLCEKQVECSVGNTGSHQCGYSNNTPKNRQFNVSKRLANNPWYKGCNESTSGYFVKDNGVKSVRGVGHCSCGGLM